MPQKIEDSKIIAYLDEMLVASTEAYRAVEKRQHMNIVIKSMMDHTYGEHKWNEINLETKEFITEEELRSTYFKVMNPSLQRRVEVTDIQSETILPTEKDYDENQKTSNEEEHGVQSCSEFSSQEGRC